MKSFLPELLQEFLDLLRRCAPERDEITGFGVAYHRCPASDELLARTPERILDNFANLQGIAQRKASVGSIASARERSRLTMSLWPPSACVQFPFCSHSFNPNGSVYMSACSRQAHPSRLPINAGIRCGVEER